MLVRIQQETEKLRVPVFKPWARGKNADFLFDPVPENVVPKLQTVAKDGSIESWDSEVVRSVASFSSLFDIGVLFAASVLDADWDS